jgi:hypothetical protein
VLLLVVLIILAIIAYSFIQQRSDARKTLNAARTSLVLAEDDLADYLRADELSAVKKQLEELKAKPPPSTFPPKDAALDLVLAIYKRAGELNARINSFTSNEAIFTLSDERLNVMSYTMSLAGSPVAVTEVLGIITAHPASLIQSLEIRPEAPGRTNRVMSLSVVVAFDPKDAVPQPVTR